MIKSISGSQSAIEICDECKTYIRDYNISNSTTWSENVTYSIEGYTVFITDNVVKCNNC